jgi:two-component system, HptB-dependent secretion and biofilm response regulator
MSAVLIEYAAMTQTDDGKEQERPEWQLELALTAAQLREANIAPLLMRTVNEIEHGLGEALTGKLFMILSELFNNALDHGLLGLDSSMKDDSVSGMDSYFEERARRLSRLEEGEIRIRMEKVSTGDCSCLKILVADTGQGFDYSALQDDALDASLRRHGRGIALVASMSGQLSYSGRGNEAHLCIPLCLPSQCGSAMEKGMCHPVGTPVNPAANKGNTQ